MIGDKSSVLTAVSAIALAATALFAPQKAEAGANPFLGDIVAVGETFCPRGWIAAEGQLLPIASNTALFSLLGTTYGGDGRTTFAVPDLRGRRAMGNGSGAGLTPRSEGERFGYYETTVTALQMPPHSHAVNANNLDGDKPGPGRKLLAAAPPNGAGSETIYSTQGPTVQMSSQMIGYTGGNQPLNIQDSFVVLRYCIATQGIFPSRS